MFGLLVPSLLALSASAQAAAPDAPSTTQEAPIVVEGRRDLERRVRRFISALAPSLPYQQLSQFVAPLCPAAAGLGEARNRLVAERMRRVAAAAGIEVAPAGCAPNVVVLVAPGKNAAVRAMYQRDPDLFYGISDRNVERLIATPGPTTSWQLEGLVGGDGQAVTRDEERWTRVVGLSTRTTSPTHPAFFAAFLVIDASAVQGPTLTQIADYAAMRTFIDTDPSRVEALGTPTILTLFDENGPSAEPVPLSLTEWDLRLLRVFYATDNRYYGNIQRNAMRHEFLEDLEAEAVAER